MLSTVKAPEDGSDELIVRFYETTGKEVQGSLWVADAESSWQSDLKETRLGEIECKEGQFEINVKPFEIKTIRVKRR